MIKSNGYANYVNNVFSPGDHSITAVYSGDNDYAAATSAPLLQTIDKASSTTALSSSLNPSNVGDPVTFTATVSPPASGTVTFKNGIASIGSGTLNGSSQAALTTSALAAGSRSITGVYSGNAVYKSSTSPVLAQVVNSNPGSTTLSAAITGKSGILSGIRTWSITVSNTGNNVATAAELDGLALSISGTCHPVATTSFPLVLGNIPVGDSRTGAVSIDFTGCAKLAKFNVDIAYSANSGASSGITQLTGVSQ